MLHGPTQCHNCSCFEDSSACKEVSRTFRHDIANLNVQALKETVEFLRFVLELLGHLASFKLPEDDPQRDMFERFKQDHLTYMSFADRKHEAQGDFDACWSGFFLLCSCSLLASCAQLRLPATLLPKPFETHGQHTMWHTRRSSQRSPIFAWHSKLGDQDGRHPGAKDHLRDIGRVPMLYR